MNQHMNNSTEEKVGKKEENTQRPRSCNSVDVNNVVELLISFLSEFELALETPIDPSISHHNAQHDRKRRKHT
jgi:hypothetical protein